MIRALPILCLAATVPAQAPAAASTPSTAVESAAAAPSFFWFATYPDRVVKFDPRRDRVVQSIQLLHGMPWGVSLSRDERQFFVTTETRRIVEVVDRDAAQVVEEHDFDEPGYIIRVQSVMEIPGNTHWYVRIDRIKKLPDRFEFEPSEYLLYHRADKKIEKRMRELPRALRGRARIAPDGEHWHVFTSQGDVSIVDPEKLEEVGKIDLSTPLFTGMGRLRPIGEDLYRGRNPGAYRFLYTMTDPVQDERSLWGVAEVSIADRKVAHLEEWGASPGFFGYRVATEAPRAAAMSFSGMGGGNRNSYDRKTRLALFDLETGRKISESLEEFRPRRSLSAISPDGRKVYVGGAGSDFLIFNDKLERVRTVELDGEIYGSVYVLDG